jgi:hypothetical protein
LFFFVHAQIRKIKCNEQRFSPPANFVYRPQARGGLEAEAALETRAAYAVDD